MRKLITIVTILCVFLLFLLVYLNIKHKKDISTLEIGSENMKLFYNELLTSYYLSTKYSNINLDSIILYDKNNTIVDLNEIAIDTTLILYIDYKMCQSCIEKEIINFKSLIKTFKYNYLIFSNFRNNVEELELNFSKLDCFYFKKNPENFYFETPMILYTVKNRIISLYVGAKNNNDNFRAFHKALMY